MNLVMTKLRALQDERATLVQELNEINAEQKRLYERKLEKMTLLAGVEGDLKRLAAERNPA